MDATTSKQGKMPYEQYRNLFKQNLSDKNFNRLSRLIQEEAGIKMPFAKKVMLEARLRKRMRALCVNSFNEYCDYLFSPDGIAEELCPMLDVVTTNKTDFFREPAHFDYLVSSVLPDLARHKGSGISRELTVWSAGCATGEEPYTLAMILSQFAHNFNNFRFSIIATDISTKALDRAKNAIYRHERISPIPMDLRKKYLLRSRNRDKQLVRIVPELRAQVRFQRLNLKDEVLDSKEKMDIIFFRNVLIYFERHTQEMILNRICRHLMQGGYLFTGHSETLHGMNLPLQAVASSVYRRS
jgi:chemotaxis protein methyltransferase CheR